MQAAATAAAAMQAMDRKGSVDVDPECYPGQVMRAASWAAAVAQAGLAHVLAATAQLPSRGFFLRTRPCAGARAREQRGPPLPAPLVYSPTCTTAPRNGGARAAKQAAFGLSRSLQLPLRTLEPRAGAQAAFRVGYTNIPDPIRNAPPRRLQPETANAPVVGGVPTVLSKLQKWVGGAAASLCGPMPAYFIPAVHADGARRLGRSRRKSRRYARNLS